MTLVEVGDTSCFGGHFLRWVTLLWLITLPEVGDTSCYSGHLKRWVTLLLFVTLLGTVVNSSLIDDTS